MIQNYCKKMLSQHKSQNSWLHDLHGMDYVEFMTQQARLRGLQAETTYAEGFRYLPVYPRKADAFRLLPGAP